LTNSLCIALASCLPCCLFATEPKGCRRSEPTFSYTSPKAQCHPCSVRSLAAASNSSQRQRYSISLIPPTIDPPVYEPLCWPITALTRFPLCSTTYTEIEPPDKQFLKERMEDIVRSKQSKMVNVLSATPYYLNDSGLPTSRSNGSTSRTRERPLRTSSRSPPPSTRSDSSTSLVRNNSGLQVPYASGPVNALNIRIIKGGLRGLERGRSQTLKRRTVEPENTTDETTGPPPEGEAPINQDSGDASPSTDTTPPCSQESESSHRQPASPEETPKQKEYVFEGVSDLTGGWGD